MDCKPILSIRDNELSYACADKHQGPNDTQKVVKYSIFFLKRKIN